MRASFRKSFNSASVIQKKTDGFNMEKEGIDQTVLYSGAHFYLLDIYLQYVSKNIM